MSHAFVRVASLPSGKLGSCEKHNSRDYEKGKEPYNINPELSEHNRHNVYAFDDDFEYSKRSLAEEVAAREKAYDVKGVRENSIKAIEIVLTINDDNFFKDYYDPEGFFSNAGKFIEERFGKNSILAISTHYDETRPHAHIVVMPLAKKEVSWKNRNGSGTKIETRYNAQEHIGSPEKLRQLQTDFHNFANSYTQRYGIELTRGVDAREQTRQYTERTNHELASLERNLDNSYTIQQLNDAMAKIALKEAQMRAEFERLNRNEIKAEKDKIFFTEKIDKIPESKMSQEKKNEAKRIPPEWGRGM